MHSTPQKIARIHHTALALAIVLALGGCANRGSLLGDSGGGLNNRRDLATASDEGDAVKRARIRYELATGYFQEGKNTVALDEIKQVLQLMPAFADGWVLRGLIYMRLNEPALAEESFRRALSLQSTNASAAHNYGWLLCKQKRYAEATDKFKAAIATGAPGASRSYMNMGICQVESGQKAQAEESFTRSLELEPGNPISGYNLALLLYQRGEYERARFYVRRINNSDLANAETLWLGIRIEHKVGNRLGEQQLADQLRNRFPASNEASALDRGAYNE